VSTDQLIEEIVKLNAKVDLLIGLKQVPDEWVGATVITKKTGWGSEDLRKARRNGSIKYKVKKEGSKRTYKYLLSSIIS
jgi:hypothetical protein